MLRLSVPASFLIESGREYEMPLWVARSKLPQETLRAWAETQRPKLATPLDVIIHRNGRMGFHDGHHRVFAANVLKTKVPVVVVRNRLKDQMLASYLDRVHKGFTYREINPGDEDDLSFIPSVAALKAGRRSGLRADYKLRAFHEKFDSEHLQ